jgi:hypothetical protein
MNESNQVPPPEEHASAESDASTVSDTSTSPGAGTSAGAEPAPDSSTASDAGDAPIPRAAFDAGTSAPVLTFNPIAKLAKAVQVLVIIQLSFAAVTLLLFFGSIVAEVIELHNLSELATNAIDIIGIVQFILYAVTGILFVIMLLRAFRNLAFLHATPTASKEWQVGWSWLIPLANLYIPFVVVLEIWKASDPAALDNVAWRQTKDSKLVGAWWILYIVFVFANGACRLLSRFLENDPQNNAVAIAILPLFICRESVFIATGVLFILVVRALVTRQEKKREALSSTT